MKEIIKANIFTLTKSIQILNELSNYELCNCSVSPYYSSIGSHLRHIHDFYDCILDGYSSKLVDLTARKRNNSIESNCDVAILSFTTIISKLKIINESINYRLNVIDDLGLGKLEIEYSFPSLLAQANSHTIHHYAIISYIMDSLKISTNIEDLGYNPTTSKLSI